MASTFSPVPSAARLAEYAKSITAASRELQYRLDNATTEADGHFSAEAVSALFPAMLRVFVILQESPVPNEDATGTAAIFLSDLLRRHVQHGGRIAFLEPENAP